MKPIKRLLCRLGIHGPRERIADGDTLLKRCRWCGKAWIVDW